MENCALDQQVRSTTSVPDEQEFIELFQREQVCNALILDHLIGGRESSRREHDEFREEIVLEIGRSDGSRNPLVQ